ncbi:DUF523 domain-containing protein [Candidatus Woesearchaeota archaeon]|mgnify:CR=1 FL=1|jgi:uncharacterized protein YbbK (DUF523 family)|nr:DUF523 domain-containing protein [Candidatus Woesearchaeota archaeon]MBT6518728.1 DUF523 domain-containing protein [Candidatus Woesearchaeota archaeon]MBT7367899.1 DUF523 domain-containing protein [Candidatus Woesearchaeota archaeon]
MIIVSACLAGMKCAWDGKARSCDKVIQLVKEGKAIPLCPEQLGGLSTPRSPVEQRDKLVVTKDGTNVSLEFNRGAQEVLKLAKLVDCKKAILKSKSPSCGSNLVYDGSFSDKLIKGDGVLAKLLKENGIEVLTEKEI